MGTFNSVVLLGNLTRDVEVKFLADGKAVGSFGIAVNSKGKDGKERADFFDVVAFEKLAENCAQYIGKGSAVLISGRLRNERWEKDGKKYSAVKIAAFDVQFLSPKKEAAPASGQQPPDDDIPF